MSTKRIDEPSPAKGHMLGWAVVIFLTLLVGLIVLIEAIHSFLGGLP